MIYKGKKYTAKIENERAGEIIKNNGGCEKMNKNEVNKFTVWQFLSQKEKDELIKKYDIKTYERLRELLLEAININVKESIKK